MASRMLIAIDPGAKGALASYTPTFEPPGEPVWMVEKLSKTPQDRAEQLQGYADTARGLERPLVAILEEVGGYAGVARPGSAMFRFGQDYGQLEGILSVLGYQILRVRPQVWQKALSLSSRGGESKPDHKRRMRQKALDLFPELKPTLDTCDALLLLYHHVTNGKDAS